jgi:nucleoside-diphosphate-sugar epimerase
MKKALLIGSEGNIGRPLSAHLRQSGFQVMESDIRPAWRDNYHVADINNPIDLIPAFDWNPDVVFLLSAMVSRVTCEQAAGLAVSTNLGGVNNVLQLCKRSNAFVVFFSTSEVYGPNCDPMTESDSDPQPNYRYGLTKLLGEQLVQYEVRTSNLRAVTIRPFMMYDENEGLGDHRSAMIRFAYSLARGRPIEVHEGSARGWLHVSDAVAAIEAATRVKEYTVVNIGHGDVRPICELAEMIRGCLGASRDLVNLKELPAQMTLVKRPSLERMRSILGIVPKVNLEGGIERVCKRIRERISNGEVG